MPLVSVVIPLYNSEKTIKETIESVLKQTLSDLEIIVINDGSTDSSLEIVKNIQDPRLQIFSYPNAGLAASRNRGIDKATGKYISFLDADDLWTPDKLEAQVKALQENPQATVVYSWTDCIDESSQFLCPDSHVTATGNVYPQMLVGYFLSNGSNYLTSRQALLEVGYYDSSINSVADWDMGLRLAAKYQFTVVPYPQVLYRISANSMSSKIIKHEAETLEIIERAFNNAPQSLQALKQQSLGNIYKYLTFKALKSPSASKPGGTATRFFWNAVKNDPSLLSSKVTGKVLFKILVLTLLPSQIADEILKKTAKVVNTSTLLGYINLDVSGNV